MQGCSLVFRSDFGRRSDDSSYLVVEAKSFRHFLDVSTIVVENEVAGAFDAGRSIIVLGVRETILLLSSSS